MTGQEDKRQFFRRMVNSACDLKIVENLSTRNVRAVCKDISATGMSVDIAQSAVAMGTIVNVHIASAYSQLASLTADTKVVRCQALGINSCNVGIEIVILSKRHQAAYSQLRL